MTNRINGNVVVNGTHPQGYSYTLTSCCAKQSNFCGTFDSLPRNPVTPVEKHWSRPIDFS